MVGRHKVLVGMAAGVGKTCRMLEEGHAAAAAGEDVAIGLLETHGRAETAALAVGLELIPRRRVAVGPGFTEELDLPAILRRAPGLCLVDELAHANPPGLEHAKRHEDVADLLAAGIDVLSTVNVQHLESVAERVEERTGVAVSETLPDAVIDTAEEVVVVDLAPEALRKRILEGKVFPAGDVPVALARFFTRDNLDELRELALLRVVEEVEAHRLAAELPGEGDRLISTAAAERHHRCLGLVTPDPSANAIVRRAWTAAEHMGGDVDLLWVVAPGDADARETDRSADELRRLAGRYGARLHVVADRSVPSAVARVVAERGVTHVVMGAPRPRRRLGRMGPSLVDELLAALPGVDLVLVAR
jgi:two-component system, OmpR family, sensor histidine kinase KdpD